MAAAHTVARTEAASEGGRPGILPHTRNIEPDDAPEEHRPGSSNGRGALPARAFAGCRRDACASKMVSSARGGGRKREGDGAQFFFLEK